jgi:hypothetical protein
MTDIPTTEEEIVDVLNGSDLYDEDAEIILGWLTALRAQAAPPPPPGAVPVRVAVAMTTNGKDWRAWGDVTDDNPMEMVVSMRRRPTAIITAWITPPAVPEIAGVVESVP